MRRLNEAGIRALFQTDRHNLFFINFFMNNFIYEFEKNYENR